ncbi:DNA/RNA non-specific endonuclease [Popillia japonica]|uniref:DNA/RNA non-specific endonuclease n=1 Tax=Popillia japonica TaxID=7064 RepID=A0AAW1HQ79_POPJA
MHFNVKRHNKGDMVSSFATLILLLQFVFPAYSSDCTISINNDLSEPQPLVLNPRGGDGIYAFYLPDNGDIITFAENQLGKLVLDGTLTRSDIGQARCVSGSFFIGEQTLPFSAITCSRIPYHIARYTGGTCTSGHREIEVGFQLSNRFLRHLRICYDSNLQSVIYSEYNLTKTIAGFQAGYPRPSWLQGSGFYTVGALNVNKLYTRAQQRITINALLGLDAFDFKYVAERGDLYLARGHLAAKADFIYGAQHRLTFYFVNAAPQWQIFNGQNWKYLEDNIRKFASRNNVDLIIYTGTHGVATLPHATSGADTELYLYANGTTRGIPIPRLFWKVFYEPKTRTGAAFIGVNNPYIMDPAKDIICTDICDRYDWLTWKADNVTLGYCYCCTLDEFSKTVTTLPSVQISQFAQACVPSILLIFVIQFYVHSRLIRCQLYSLS